MTRDLAGLREAIANRNLSRWTEEIVRVARVGLQLVPLDQAGGGHRSPLAGATKLGGRPSMPPDAHWPEINGRPLAFVAQLDLADLHDTFARELFRGEGMLSFFHLEGSGDQGTVLEFIGPGLLIDRVPPARGRRGLLRRSNAPLGFTEVGVAVREIITLPSLEALLKIAPNRADDLDRLLEQVNAPYRMLGYGDSIQGEIEAELQGMVSGGENREWRALLQLNSAIGPFAHRRWGDGGILSVGISASDLAARRYDECVFVIQCS